MEYYVVVSAGDVGDVGLILEGPVGLSSPCVFTQVTAALVYEQHVKSSNPSAQITRCSRETLMQLLRGNNVSSVYLDPRGFGGGSLLSSESALALTPRTSVNQIP